VLVTLSVGDASAVGRAVVDDLDLRSRHDVKLDLEQNMRAKLLDQC
jgi:hypothetical protein